jgi:hypothetical protein
MMGLQFFINCKWPFSRILEEGILVREGIAVVVNTGNRLFLGWAGELLHALQNHRCFHEIIIPIMLMDFIAGTRYDVSSYIINGLARGQ